MKKNFLYAVMSAIALTGAVGFSACSSSDEITEEVNPTFDGNSVRTDFAFSITKASQATTRMDAENTQSAGNNFLGMSDMYLFPFSVVPGAGSTTNLPTDGPKNYSLGSLEENEISSSKSSKVYTLSIPVGTNNFLFYGKAPRTSNVTEDFTKGKLTSTITAGTSGTASPDNISFSLNSISSSLGTDATNIAAYLTEIANAKTTSNIAWSESGTRAGSNASFSGLSKLYTEFTKEYVDRSGSAESVVRMVLDLYKSAYAINAQSSDTDVKEVAKAICQAIETETSDVYVIIKNGSTVVDIDAQSPVDVTTADLWTATASGFNETFPANLNLPMGAALMKWVNSTTGFIYVDNPLYIDNISSLTSTNLNTDKYCYPAELIYYDNSPLRATTSYKKVGDYPTTTATWDQLGSDGFSSDWTETSVSSATRAVAMRNNVNYGVALLETTVALKSNVTALTDNMKGIVSGASENQTDLAPSDFEVTGLLIGGQPASVDWDMTNPDDGFANVIYDKEVVFDDPVNPTASTPVNRTLDDLSTSITNYTIVLDNYASGDQKDVRIALQLKNKGKDFYGAHGLIPEGSTFYLVGDLDISEVSDHTIPNINDGTNTFKRNYIDSTDPDKSSPYRITEEGTKRVFIQDYKTVANITLGQYALQNAYSIIPDLRSTEVLFGLSVSLTWETGVEFNVTIGDTGND